MRAPSQKTTTPAATSSGVPFRFIGVLAANPSYPAPTSPVVTIIPGATQIHTDLRRPCLRHRGRQHMQRRLRRAVMPMRPPRDESPPATRYSQSVPVPPSAPGCAAFATRNGPRVFVANIPSHCSTEIASSGAVLNIPALFTSRSSPPIRPTTSPTAAPTLSSDCTSHPTAKASEPSPRNSSAVTDASSRDPR